MAGEKMDLTMIVVCAVVGSLGLLSAILGFSAEGTKLTLSDIVRIGDACLYPQNPALALGVCASIFLIMAQATVAAIGGCCGSCGKKPATPPSETKRIAAVVCAVFSWITAVAAFMMLVYGAALNANVVRHTYPVCYVLLDGIFAGGAVLALVATALGLTSYILLRRKPADTPMTGEQQQQTAAAGIAMAQTQLSLPLPPPQPAPPQGQAPPYYPQYNASSHGYEQFPHPPAQGYGSHGPNQQFPPQSYGAHMSNQHFPPHGYGAHACNVQVPPQGYVAHEPNQQVPPQGYGAHKPNQQFAPQVYGTHEPNQLQLPPPAADLGYEPHAHVPPPPSGHEQV